jgi:hypothetical protein
MNLLVLLLTFAAPFWQSKAPADWSQQELDSMFTDSPWGQLLAASGRNDAPQVAAYFATAAPMETAERERDRRAKRKNTKPVEDPMAGEYRAWLAENRATQIVLAIAVGGKFDDQDSARMQEECVMRVGRKKIRMSGYFPPSSTDPYLRLAFPREVAASAKTVTFELYIPGVALPFRSAEFKVSDMILNGKLEM